MKKENKDFAVHDEYISPEIRIVQTMSQQVICSSLDPLGITLDSDQVQNDGEVTNDNSFGW